MEMNREFIHAIVKDIKTEKDRIKADILKRFSSLETTINTFGLNLEAGLRHNFPVMQFPPFIYHQNSMTIPIIDSEDLNIVKGETEVITTFKRHIDFLKLVAKSAFEIEQLEANFNKYFIYWDNQYYYNKYDKGLSPEIKTKLPNLILSIDKIRYILSGMDKNTLQITSGEHDVWQKNAPVEYNYNYTTNQFDLTFDNSLTCSVRLHIINECPELDLNIGNAINKAYMDNFGFDYFKFEEVNNKFIKFIVEYLTEFLITRFEDWTKLKKRNDWDYGDFELIYEPMYQVSFDDSKANVLFKFHPPKDDSISNQKRVEFSIKNLKSNNECTITVRLSGIQQTLVFKLSNQENTQKSISFMGYIKDSNSTKQEVYLQYFTEEYKLFVLYYGGFLLAQREEFLNKLDISITTSLSEQIAKEEIRMQIDPIVKPITNELSQIKLIIF